MKNFKYKSIISTVYPIAPLCFGEWLEWLKTRKNGKTNEPR